MNKKEKQIAIANYDQLFEEIKRGISMLDPVSFAENHLTIDGKPFDLSGSGWKYMAEIYRTVASQVENKNARPIVMLKGRQVGATIMAAVLSLYMTASGLYGTEADKPPIRVMHLFPALKNMSVYAKDTLSTMMSNSKNGFITSRSLRKDRRVEIDIEDAITQKNFIGFNKLRIDSVGKTGDRIRGSTQDVLFFDEFQSMPQAAVENSVKVLTATSYGAPTKGVQVYFGTPFQSGSYFWSTWEESDKRFYQLRCVRCEHYFYLYNLEDDNWMDIWVSGQTVKCPECSHKQDKRTAVDGGRWFITNPGAKYIGYHFNMMLSPLYTKENVLEYHPSYGKNVSDRAWKNETLGTFYSGGAVPLTFEELVSSALDETRGTSKGITTTNGRLMVMGIDWGDKAETDDDVEKRRGKSYTAVVVASVDPNGIMTVENAFRLKDNAFDYKIEVVQKLIEEYKIDQSAADYFHGQDPVRHLQNTLGMKDKFLACINSANINKILSYNEDFYRVTLNKDMMLEEIFGMIKRGKIKFPAQGLAFEQMRWLMDHCCSMEVRAAVKNDNIIRRYEKGTVQNDGLMALMYAVIASRFKITGGFKGASETKAAENKRPLPVVGLVPRL